MALPNPPAAAYDGYIYTERICQEYGQQPRYYQVRNPIPGSDWRNDGGWAIVLERGSNVSPPVYSFGAAQPQGGFSSQSGALNLARAALLATTSTDGIPGGTFIVAQDGTQGWVEGFIRDLVVDRNGDGVLNEGDVYQNGQWYWERRAYSVVSTGSNYGTQYIRWANLMWCR